MDQHKSTPSGARKALLNLSCSTSVATEEEWESLILSYMMKAIPLLGVCYLITQEMRLLRVCVCVCVCVCASWEVLVNELKTNNAVSYVGFHVGGCSRRM